VKITLLALILGAVSSFCSVCAFSDQGLITEVEQLRASLPAQDATRPTLTLRLADLCFDEIGSISRGHELNAAQQSQVSQLQRKAVGNYTEALNGANGQFKPLSGTLALKVQFQLARLYADMGRTDLSNPLWVGLVSQELLPELKREASLRLAENAESNHDYARSDTMYRQAIALCNGLDLCSYAHYRLAWVMKNQGNLNGAIAEVQLALWDSKGQVREEALRDFMTFLGERPSDGKTETTMVEGLIAKINRPTLLSDLSSAFFAAGNRPAGVYTLSLVDSRSPSIKGKVRLLEEYYGLKNWDAFHRTLDEVKLLKVTPELASDVETEKVLKRLTVQLDGERVSQPQYVPDFKAAVELHLTFFPRHEDTFKMMEGWLAAETNDDLKAAALASWLTSPAFQLSQSTMIQLHETRAAVAQKKKDDAMTAAEMQALSQLVSDPAKKREYRYVYARSLYSLKRNEECLPVFLELADVSSVKPDQWAIQSQNLALDIYGQRKDYDAVALRASAWTQSPVVLAAAQKDAALARELVDMKAIAEKSSFQKATAQGAAPQTSAAGLGTFAQFCIEGKLLPQAALLEAQQKTKAMAPGPEQTKSTLKIALLYELGEKNADRDRLLTGLLKSLQKQKSFGELENLLFATYKDASLLTPQQLTLAWTPRNRALIAEALESSGQANAQTNAQTSAKTREILLATLQSTGPRWNAHVLEALTKLDMQQGKISFYGARSQKKFTNRLDALKRMVSFSEKYIPGADVETRAKMLTLLETSHQELADAILKTPIPDAVQGEQITQVKDALAKMAEPFQEKTKAYAELLQKNGADVLNVSQSAPLATAPADSLRASAVEALHTNPSDMNAIVQLRSYYESIKKDRLAGYFKGRINHDPNSK
jgi:hypothetical protein